MRGHPLPRRTHHGFHQGRWEKKNCCDTFKGNVFIILQVWGAYSSHNGGVLYCGGAKTGNIFSSDCEHFCPSRFGGNSKQKYYIFCLEYISNQGNQPNAVPKHFSGQVVCLDDSGSWNAMGAWRTQWSKWPDFTGFKTKYYKMMCYGNNYLFQQQQKRKSFLIVQITHATCRKM